jgi:hypothetical protein
MLFFWCGMRISNLLIYFNARHFCAVYGFTVYTKEPTAVASEPQQFFNSSTNNSCRCVGVALLEGMGGRK